MHTTSAIHAIADLHLSSDHARSFDGQYWVPFEADMVVTADAAAQTVTVTAAGLGTQIAQETYTYAELRDLIEALTPPANTRSHPAVSVQVVYDVTGADPHTRFHIPVRSTDIDGERLLAWLRAAAGLDPYDPDLSA